MTDHCIIHCVNFNLHLLNNRLSTWRAISLTFSFLTFILLSTRFYNVSQELNFLELTLSHFKADNSSFFNNSTKLEIKFNSYVDSFKQDIQILIAELNSSYNTLLLSIVFVSVYIFSWLWMAFTIQSNNFSKEITMRTILSLTIFSAVDIAASIVFVIIRIVMYMLKNNSSLNDFRTSLMEKDYNQTVAFTAFRFSFIQSSSNTSDVFVSSIITFLTLFRIYNVVCSVSFYNQARESVIIYHKYLIENYKNSNKSSLNVDKSLLNTSIKKKLVSRKCSITDSSLNIQDDFEIDIQVQASDMPNYMQKFAIESTAKALKLYSLEKNIAASIKQDFDQRFEPTWHCIVGKNWGSCVTHSKQHYIRMINSNLIILLYKSS